MRHQELLPAICLGLAVAFARLRWVILTQLRCRACGDAHLHCVCKPAWVKKLL